MRRIILVRHGRSSHLPSAWVDAAGVDAWLRAYDAAGLAVGETPPGSLREVASRAGLVVTSDMPRAVETAALLAARPTIRESSLLREAPLPVPSIRRLGAGARAP